MADILKLPDELKEQIRTFVEETNPYVVVIATTQGRSSVSTEFALAFGELTATAARCGFLVDMIFADPQKTKGDRKNAINVAMAQALARNHALTTVDPTALPITHFFWIDTDLGWRTLDLLLAMMRKLPVVGFVPPSAALNLDRLVTQPGLMYRARVGDNAVEMRLAKPSIEVEKNGGAYTAHSVQQQIGLYCFNYDGRPALTNGSLDYLSDSTMVNADQITSRALLFTRGTVMALHGVMKPLLLPGKLSAAEQEFAVDYFQCKTALPGSDTNSDPDSGLNAALKNVLKRVVPMDVTMHFSINGYFYVRSANMLLQVMSAEDYKKQMKHFVKQDDRVGSVLIA